MEGEEKVKEVEGETGDADTLDITLWKYLIFSAIFSFFISLKLFLYGINLSSSICFSFNVLIIERSVRNQKQSWIIRTFLPDYPMSICFLALLLYLLNHLAFFTKHTTSHLLLIHLGGVYLRLNFSKIHTFKIFPPPFFFFWPYPQFLSWFI